MTIIVVCASCGDVLRGRWVDEVNPAGNMITFARIVPHACQPTGEFAYQSMHREAVLER